MQVKHADVAGCGLMAAEATGFFLNPIHATEETRRNRKPRALPVCVSGDIKMV